MRRTVGVLFLSAFVTVLAACGGGSDEAVDTAPADTTTAETSPPDTEPRDTQPTDTAPADTEPVDTEPTDTEPADTEPAATEEDAVDLAIAEAGLLTLDDMPQNWTESPIDDDDAAEDDSPAIDAAQRDFTACFGVEPDGEGDPFGIGGARASSGEFADARGGFTITNKVGITDEAGASLVIERYSADSVPECVVPAMVAVVEAGFASDPDLAEYEVGDVTVEQLELTQWGDGTIGYRTVVPVTSPNESFELYMDQIVVRVGRGLTSLQFQSPNSPFEVFEVDSYAMLAAERLTEALQGE
ncbi:MAG: hypothetical protein ABWZ99_17175 [Ilumatobacteraceae bacterium]